MLDAHCHQKLQRVRPHADGEDDGCGGGYGTSRQRCVNTPQEILYTENGDILQYVLRRLAAS